MQLKHFLCLILILFLSESCHKKYTENNIILSAEKVLFSSPDSAYKLLKSINHPEKLPEADYATWCLHYVHARFKLYITEQRDTTLLNVASNYYQKNGSDKYLGTAYYLHGRFANDIEKNNTRAMSYFKRATKKLEKTTEYNTLGLSYFLLCHLYLSTEMTTESNEYIKKAIYNFKKSNNEIYLYYSYRTNAEIRHKLEEPIQNVISEINKCEKLVLKYKDTLFYNNLILFKAETLVEIDKQTSKKILIKEFSKFKSSQISVYLAYIYAKQDMPDSARYYFNYVISNEFNTIDRFAYEVTSAYLFKSEKKYKNSIEHLENAYEIRQKKFEQSNKSLLLKIDKQYDYSQKEKERANLEIANQQKIILIILLSLFIIIGLFVQLQIRNRHKLNQKRMELEQQKMKFEIEFQKSENTQNLTIIQNNIKNKIDNTIKFKRLNTGISNKEKIDDFLTEITQQSFISEKELHYYMIEADKLYGNRISNLKNEFPNLTSTDLIVISLIALGIDLNNCCQLLNISLTSLYTRRKRIKNHLEIDKSINLENWVEQKIIKSEFN